MNPDQRMSPDEETQFELLESMSLLRRQGYVIDRLETAPLHVPGCDDVNNRFAWYIRINPEGVVEGYFHMPKEVDF